MRTIKTPSPGKLRNYRKPPKPGKRPSLAQYKVLLPKPYKATVTTPYQTPYKAQPIAITKT